MDLLTRIETGVGTSDEIDLLLDVCDRIEGKCLCPLGDACAMPVRSHILRFREEFEEHVRSGGCPFGETSALSTLAPKPKTRLPAGERLMAATEAPATVTLEVDGRSITVPKGTPLVIAAAQAGVEVPVFCYEPRLGAPIGACRMCLVEIEGMPKLQAGCTMTATDGMVVRTAHASEKAKDGQDAVLEFILLNHPLDCPVCDKGGECPLQDLTFRYGPGNTRMTLPKRTYEKPLPISPSIVLDRERCILCYRCTRFSEDVSEDGELIARERGANSVIATFEERPYTGVFSGNVTELCPVGALLPTPYRFKARPWEIVNVPTVCGSCPTGCNIWATLREGKVERILSRNHPEVDDGWLCDRGRFARHEPLADRISRAATAAARRASRPPTGRTPRDSPPSACATSRASTARARWPSWSAAR